MYSTRTSTSVTEWRQCRFAFPHLWQQSHLNSISSCERLFPEHMGRITLHWRTLRPMHYKSPSPASPLHRFHHDHDHNINMAVECCCEITRSPEQRSRLSFEGKTKLTIRMEEGNTRLLPQFVHIWIRRSVELEFHSYEFIAYSQESYSFHVIDVEGPRAPVCLQRAPPV